MRIDIFDVRVTPAIKYSYASPFKRATYQVDDQGGILLEIVRPLNLITYDLMQAKKVSSLRRVTIQMFDFIGEKEYKVRELGGNFRRYVLNEIPQSDGSVTREEILIFEITDVN
jgi:hypothetical protein